MGLVSLTPASSPILDLAGYEIISVATTKDNQMKRPRPLMMLKVGNGIRLYSGKDYVEIAK